MVVRAVVGMLACLLLAGAATWVHQAQIHPRMDRSLDEELLYLPNENLLTHFTGGLSGVLADILWIRTISYASEEFRSAERKFTWLEHMIRTVTRMDPYYEAAYANGGMMLSSLGQDDRSLPLLQEGLIRLPDSVQISQELLNIYLLNRRKEPGAPAVSLHYLQILANNSDNPEPYMELMDRIRASNSLEGEARRVWTDLLESSPDAFVRRLARNQILLLDAEALLGALQSAADDFERARGARPRTLSELTSFLGPAAPGIPEELGRFYVGPDGAVRSSMLDRRTSDRYRRVLAGRIGRYERQHGARPESLEALREADAKANIKHPIPGFEWRYNPQTGELSEAAVRSENE